MQRYVEATSGIVEVARAPVLRRSLGLDVHLIEGPETLIFTNPSVATHSGRRVVAVREVNYLRTRWTARPIFIDGSSVYRSRTWVYVYEEGSWSLCGARLLDTAQALPSTQYGLEDPRLFVLEGSLWCLWTLGSQLDDGELANRMVMAEVGQNVIRDFHLLRSPYSLPREKNWMPFIVDGALHVVYDLAHLEVYRVIGDTLDRVSKRDAPVPELMAHSGSSQLIPWGTEWLGVSHRVLWTPRRLANVMPHRFYVHHFILLSRDYELRALSRGFFFTRRGIEFCAGLAAEGQKVIVSFGSNCSAAMLMELSARQLASLFP
ncbi:MAG: hypothetical protein ABSC56_01530 [Solirubrobacteraceae bacterium]